MSLVDTVSLLAWLFPTHESEGVDAVFRVEPDVGNLTVDKGGKVLRIQAFSNQRPDYAAMSEHCHLLSWMSGGDLP